MALTDEDIDQAVDEATSEETFDALEFFSGSTLPDGKVTLYRDTAAAVRLDELARTQAAQEKTEESEGLGITDEVEYIDPDEVDELKTRLKESAVTFHLRAIAPAARNALEKSLRAKHNYREGDANNDYYEAFNGNLIAKSIVSVVNAKGQKDTSKWDAARVLKFIDMVEPSEWNKVFSKTYDLNYIGDAIDRAVNADF